MRKPARCSQRSACRSKPGWCCSHVQTILRGCGADLQDVVKCSVFLSDAQRLWAMNEVYAEVFGANKPARTTVAAGMVATGMKVEIDCIAYRPTTA